MRAVHCLMFLIALPLVACDSRYVKTPTAMQPKLTGVDLVGNRVCGAFDVTDHQYNFNCPDLPTIEATGWQLTPLNKEDIPPVNTKFGWNSTFRIHVQTPSLTSLEIVYVPTRRSRWVLKQVLPPKEPGHMPPMLQSRGKVWVEATDNGTVKDWVVVLSLNTCQESAPLEVVNIDNQGGRSNPLNIYALRRPSEISNCSGLGGGGGGVGSGGVGSGGTLLGVSTVSPNSSQSIPQPEPCTEQLFMFCERCAPGLEEVRYYHACSQRMAEFELNYRNRATGEYNEEGLPCHPKLITDPASCRP